MYGIFSQQKSSTPVSLPKGYMIVRKDNKLQKTYDMVNFTTIANYNNNFNNAKYNTYNNSIYFALPNTIARLNLDNNTINYIYGNAASNVTFQLNTANQSIIGRDYTSGHIFRIELYNHSVSTYNWGYYSNNVIDGTTNTNYMRSDSSFGYTEFSNSPDGIKWTIRWSANGTGASGYLSSINGLLSTHYRRPYTGQDVYSVSNNGGTTVAGLSTTVNYNKIINFDENEYMLTGINSRVPYVSTDGTTWSSYTFPQTGTYSIYSGTKSPDGVYLVTGSNGMIFRKQGDFTSATGWTTITSPFSASTSSIWVYSYTDRFIISNGTQYFTSLDGINWTEVTPGLNANLSQSCFVPE